MTQNKRNAILIVDDEEPILDLLSGYLEASYDCATASSAQMALTLMASRSFDLVLTDYLMPDMTGIELYEQIQKKYPQTAVLFVSGSPAFIQKALQRGYELITKPFRLPEVDTAIERALNQRSRLPHR